jgi:hypothetical protein
MDFPGLKGTEVNATLSRRVPVWWQPNDRRAGAGAAVAESAGMSRQKSLYGAVPFRKLLEHKKIDVVINATPEHWHTLINRHCLAATRSLRSGARSLPCCHHVALACAPARSAP